MHAYDIQAGNLVEDKGFLCLTAKEILCFPLNFPSVRFSKFSSAIIVLPKIDYMDSLYACMTLARKMTTVGNKVTQISGIYRHRVGLLLWCRVHVYLNVRRNLSNLRSFSDVRVCAWCRRKMHVPGMTKNWENDLTLRLRVVKLHYLVLILLHIEKLRLVLALKCKERTINSYTQKRKLLL